MFTITTILDTARRLLQIERLEDLWNEWVEINIQYHFFVDKHACDTLNL